MSGLTTGRVAAIMAAKGYQVIPGPDVPVTGGAADSRRVRPGDLFTAFPGEHVDGNAFVADALANGAVAAICERAPAVVPPGCTVVVAPDATRAVGELAHAWRMHCQPKVVGITGTVGKTTAKEMTAGILRQRFRTHWSEGNLNSREGLPLALLSLAEEHEVSVLEMGMDRPGEIVQLCEIAQPDVGVVLNIGLTHVLKLGSIEAIAQEKLSLVRWLPARGIAVANQDDPRIAEAIPGLRCRVLAYGRGAAEPRPFLAWSDARDMGANGVRFFAHTKSRTARVDSRVPGEHTVPSVVAAMTAAMALGMTLYEAANAVRRSGVTGRARTITTASGVTVIDDRYNSSPASLAGALRSLRLRTGTRIALIGKMAELGAHEIEEHTRAGRLAAECCDLLVTFGETCLPLAEGARAAAADIADRGQRAAEVHWFATREEAAGFVAARLSGGDVVLVKGSRSEALEDVLPLLGVQE